MIGRWINRAGAKLRNDTDRGVAPAAADPLEAGSAEVDVLPTSPSPAFARRAMIAGADGLLAQPAFARSPFTPTRPVQAERALIGRRPQLERAIAAIESERAHIAIFGERGHGKTSLANVVVNLAEAAGYGVVRHACTADATISDLIGALLDKVPPRFLRRAAGDPAEAPPGARLAGWTVAEATAALEGVRAGHLLLVIDEFDRLRCERTKRDVTELLKNASDLGLRVSFVLIGVAESLDELLVLHRSIQRSLVSIPLPLLLDDDIALLLAQGCERLGLQLDPDARAALLLLAHRSPYYGQLLSLHATDATRRRGGDRVERRDVAAAAAMVLVESRHAFEPLLAQLPREGREWRKLLLAAAMAPCDGFGWFGAESVGQLANRVGLGLPMDVPAALAMLAQSDAGPILRERRMSERAEFSFARVNLRNYVLLREARLG